jgi:Mg/Co/Ni transporter MgtE
VVDILRNDICPLHIEDEGINTLSIMDDYKIPQLPVVNENNELLGLIEEDAIVNMEDLNKSLEFIQHKINKVFVLFDAHIFEAMKIITEHQLSLLPVVNQDHNYIGYLEAIDIISKLGAMCTHYSNTCIIVIATKPKNYIQTQSLCV